MIALLTFLAQSLTGFYQVKREMDQTVAQREQWFRLALSLGGTAFVTFWGVLGITGTALLAGGHDPIFAIAGACFAGALAMAAAVLTLWKRSPLTRGVGILAPVQVEAESLKGGVAITEPAPATETRRQ